MTYLKWRTHPTLSDIFDNVFEKEHARMNKSYCYDCTPSVNIVETNAAFELEIAVPGLKKDDIKINLESNVLSISSEKELKEDDGRVYLRREFAYGTFNRAFTLPKNVDADAIKADFVDGILKVALPKKAETKLSKEISIA
jgi:HSP20 family protein